MKRFWEGFSLGMVLQVAVGPVCLAVFSLGTGQGFGAAWQGAMGAVAADVLFVALALFGVGALMKNPSVQRGFGIFGAVVITAFGLELLLGSFGLSLLALGRGLSLLGGGGALPQMGGAAGGEPFLKILLVTLSNPMAILFWIGVFSVKIGEIQGGVYAFAAGALTATFIFLTLVAFGAALTRTFLPQSILRWVNAAVGLALIVFGVGRLFKKPASPANPAP